MNKELMEAQDIFLDKINQICKKLGLNNVMAQLYAILYLSDEALSLDDMVERLKISKGSASVNIRALENYGAARRVWIRGSRKDYYEADTDIMRVIMDRVNLIGKIRLSEIDTMVKSCNQVLNSVNSADKDESDATKAFKHKLDKIETLRKQADSLFCLLNSGILNNLLSKKPLESEKESSFAASVG